MSSDNNAAAVVKYKGVRLRKWGKYVAEIRLPNSRDRIWLGSHNTAEKAARAFDAALFCLRGPQAKFNFPDQPPNIVRGQELTVEQIQAAAQEYANSFSASTGGGSGPGNNYQPPLEEAESESPCSVNSEDVPAGICLLDWPFSEFDQFFGGLGDEWYMPFPIDGHYRGNDDDDDDGNAGNVEPLWSFPLS